MLRPVLVCVSALATASCGMVEGDPNRFENMARLVAEVPLDGSTDAPTATAREQGLRPAFASHETAPHTSSPGRLKVEVMDPHDLWDARDAGLRGAITQGATRAVEAAAPAVAEAVVQRVSDRIAEAAPMRPAIARAATPTAARTTIQLGAYSSPEAARAAWTDVSSGAARSALKGLTPVFEAVQVNGRPFTRLKVAAPAAAASAICRAAEVTDPWCARRT
ncbi:SPOR domain-containing protein [Brevundimonas sp.]|uniref:SPOR domain-containing protein n=1 Tax=Brevundimonas sp. TaxID=1871086 RepID=UPI0037842A96